MNARALEPHTVRRALASFKAGTRKNVFFSAGATTLGGSRPQLEPRAGTGEPMLDGSFSSLFFFDRVQRERQRTDRFFTKQLIVCTHFFSRGGGRGSGVGGGGDLFLVGSVFTSLFDFVTKSVSLLNLLEMRKNKNLDLFVAECETRTPSNCFFTSGEEQKN